MGKAIVVYSTRTGETKQIADLIAEGIRMQGCRSECGQCHGSEERHGSSRL